MFFRILALFSVLSTQAFAIEWSEVRCWQGYSQDEQNSNMKNCKREISDLTMCTDNMWIHKRGAYDICLMQASKPKKVLTRFPGWNQKDQNRNMQSCKQQQSDRSICVSNAWIHGQGVYDVCLME
jgi:hypothetical protein